MKSTSCAGESRTEDLLAPRLKGNNEKTRFGVIVSVNG